jgi:hypothetical protein
MSATRPARPRAAELLSERMPALLERLRPDYDVIVIDPPPVLPVSDSFTIAPWCTGALVAVALPPPSDARSPMPSTCWGVLASASWERASQTCTIAAPRAQLRT